MITRPHRSFRLLITSLLVGALAVVAAGPTSQRPPGGVIAAPVPPRSSVASESGPLPVVFGAPSKKATTGAQSRRGYTRLNSRLIGVTPAGYQVWVDPRSPHRSIIARNVARAVSQLRRLGLRVRWRGYGMPKPVEGTLRIRESSAGCQGGPNVVGMTWPYLQNLPNGDLYVYRAEIALCPRLFRLSSWQWAATVHHELGHAMGLNHTNYKYRGSYQVMNAVTHPGVTTYRSGDARGLRALAANNNRVKNELPPIGRLETAVWKSGNGFTFTGWALLSYHKMHGVTITVTEDGKVVSRGGTTVARPTINRAYDPGRRRHGFSIRMSAPRGRHTYCVRATSPVNRVAVAALGCVSLTV